MKIGLKLWSTNKELFNKANYLYNNKEIDYVELYVIPGSFKSGINKLNMPTIIHAPHSGHKFNIANKSLLKSNMEKFEEVKKFAQELNALKIIVHPGYNGEIYSALKCLEKFNYENILIENMPVKGLHNENCLGYIPENIKWLLDIGFKFCLDFSHAYKAAVSLNLNAKKLIKSFLKLNPYMFHICDGNINNEFDEHLNLGEGNFDLKFIKNCIGDKFVTFETPKKNNLINDIKNIKYFKGIR